MALIVPNASQPIVDKNGNATSPMQLFMAGVAPAIQNFSVTNLPMGALGLMATVTDGDAALAWGATITNTGTSSTKYLVWWNGAHWTVVGK